VRHRRSIGVAVLAVALAAWPTAFYFARERPGQALNAIAVAWLAFLVGCVIFLRSSVIAGALLGILLVLAAAFLGLGYGPRELVLCAIIGSVIGWHCEVLIGPRKPRA
jgi:hypothetical protein